MEYLIGACIGSILTIFAFPFLFNITVFLLWGLGFLDMDMNASTPDWLTRLRNKFKSPEPPAAKD